MEMQKSRKQVTRKDFPAEGRNRSLQLTLSLAPEQGPVAECSAQNKQDTFEIEMLHRYGSHLS